MKRLFMFFIISMLCFSSVAFAYIDAKDYELGYYVNVYGGGHLLDVSNPHRITPSIIMIHQTKNKEYISKDKYKYVNADSYVYSLMFRANIEGEYDTFDFDKSRPVVCELGGNNYPLKTIVAGRDGTQEGTVLISQFTAPCFKALLLELQKGSAAEICFVVPLINDIAYIILFDNERKEFLKGIEDFGRRVKGY